MGRRARFIPAPAARSPRRSAPQRIAAGETFALRLDVAQALARTGPLFWEDDGAGRIAADAALLGDVVLARKDTPTSYHLAVTVDDALQGVTLVTRGEDLFAATHVHRLLQALLDLPTPRYCHHPLLVDAAGRRLAKRDKALTLRALREAGHTAPAGSAPWPSEGALRAVAPEKKELHDEAMRDHASAIPRKICRPSRALFRARYLIASPSHCKSFIDTTRPLRGCDRRSARIYPSRSWGGRRWSRLTRSARGVAMPAARAGVWHWLCLVGILLLALALRLWALDQNGYGNEYYSAGVRSMLASWHNLFFNAFDPAGFVSLDKPPVAFWIQAASAKLFGFSGLSVLLPQVVEGVAAIILLFHLVRVRFGVAAALLAALFLALTPVSVAVDRSTNTESCLVLIMLAPAWPLARAAERGSFALLALAMVLLGIAFNVKMLAALVVLPAFLLVYALGAPLGSGSDRRSCWGRSPCWA